MSTGRDLDVAVQGKGYIAVQGTRWPRGLYPRRRPARGFRSASCAPAPALPVLGDGGPITVPPHASLLVGGDGTISIVPLGQGPETMAVVGRIKLVNPATRTS